MTRRRGGDTSVRPLAPSPNSDPAPQPAPPVPWDGENPRRGSPGLSTRALGAFQPPPWGLRTGPGRSPEPRFSRASASNLSPRLSFLPHWERGNGVNHVAATRGARAGGIPCSRSPRRAAGARPGSAECAACLGGGGARACNIGLGIITFNVKKI